MKPYIKILIKQNIAYFILIAVMIVGTLLSSGYLFGLYDTTRVKLNQTNEEIDAITKRLTVLRTLSQRNTKELEDNLEIMNSLIPNSEDYFSIIYALDQLSQKTGFAVNSYTVDLTASRKDRLALSVSGIGDPQTFLSFLREYNTGGGRLITADTIQLESSNNSAIKLQLYFYSKAASEDSAMAGVNYEEILRNFDTIRSKVSVSIANNGSENGIEPESEVRGKSNPF